MNSKEYKEFLQMLENDEISEKDVYNEIMSKEKSYLEEINKIVENKKSDNNNAFFNLSIPEHYMKFTKCIHNIFKECMSIKNIKEVPWIILYEERKIYIGLLIVVTSMFLFFVTIST